MQSRQDVSAGLWLLKEPLEGQSSLWLLGALQACKLFSKLGLPLQLRSFPSGAVVVQASLQ